MLASRNGACHESLAFIEPDGRIVRLNKSDIGRHLKNIFETGELVRDSVVAIFATTAADGKTYQVEYFDLDAIISVGHRVNRKREKGTQFPK